MRALSLALFLSAAGFGPELPPAEPSPSELLPSEPLTSEPAPAATRPFDVDLTRPPGPSDGPCVEPSIRVALPEGWSGQYLVAGDLDGDGTVEIVTGRNDEQVLTAIGAVKLDGSILWRWGKEGSGVPTRFYDLPLQIFDHDGDGRPEVFAGIEGEILVLGGKDGAILRRLPLPEGLRVADCIVFARLTGRSGARDILIKDRYRKIWAFDASWKPLWEIADPGGYRTAHHPEPIDIDGDGLDEIVAGYSLLGREGKVLWTVESRKTDLARGHLDCARPVRLGKAPEDARIALSCCGANSILLVDGNGKTLWEIAGHHFESIDVGELRPDVPGREIVVDVDHRPYGDGPIWVISEAGELLGTYRTNYARYHHLLDWDGDGVEEIVLPNALRIVDGRGRTVAALAVPEDAREALLGKPGDRSNEAPFLLLGNFTGRGRRDVILNSHRVVLIYANPAPGEPPERLTLGSEPNFTLY